MAAELEPKWAPSEITVEGQFHPDKKRRGSPWYLASLMYAGGMGTKLGPLALKEPELLSLKLKSSPLIYPCRTFHWVRLAHSLTVMGEPKLDKEDPGLGL